MENITEVYLLNVPLEKDYKHTLYFLEFQHNIYKPHWIVSVICYYSIFERLSNSRCGQKD